jgi:hypothetical protein
MKKYEPYKNIRKQAVIFGLNLPLFALFMVAVIASLLVIIFSFSLGVIIIASVFNVSLYITLLRINRFLEVFQMIRIFPAIISNKRNSSINYEKD